MREERTGREGEARAGRQAGQAPWRVAGVQVWCVWQVGSASVGGRRGR